MWDRQLVVKRQDSLKSVANVRRTRHECGLARANPDTIPLLLAKEFSMPESEVKNIEFTPKPKCIRCGAEHSVSDLGHWMPGWWTCQICNVRWEEDEFE
jgi:hypothetical protein